MENTVKKYEPTLEEATMEMMELEKNVIHAEVISLLHNARQKQSYSQNIKRVGGIRL